MAAVPGCGVWPVNAACSFGIPVDPVARTSIQAYAVESASEILWRLTAGVYGVCSITVRPCGRKCAGFSYTPLIDADGVWFNVACGHEDDNCGCCEVAELSLPGPVVAITQVRIDGLVVDPATYRVDNGYLLTRVGSATKWPKCQDLWANATQDNTFEIIYDKGVAVPVGGQRAVAALAAEIIKSCAGSACRLPARVQQFARQGITVDLMNDTEFLRSGLTGLPEVDLWVSSVNPYNQRTQSSVYSPDLPRMRVTG